MKKKKSKKKEKGFAGDRTALSTLGEALQQTNPEVAQKFQEIRSSLNAADRLVEVVNDVLPFNWTDSELFEEGVRLAVEGQYQEAAEVLEEVIRYNPDAYPAYHLLGYVCGCRKNYKDEAENYRKETIERARSDAAQAKIRAESKAETVRIEGTAETENEKQKLDAILGSLNTQAAVVYLELEKARTFRNTEKLVVVPSDSKLVLPFGKGAIGPDYSD